MGRVTKLEIGESRIETFEILVEDGFDPCQAVRKAGKVEKVGGFRVTDVVVF